MVEPQQQKVLKILHKENEIQTRKGGEYHERPVLRDFNRAPSDSDLISGFCVFTLDSKSSGTSLTVSLYLYYLNLTEYAKISYYIIASYEVLFVIVSSLQKYVDTYSHAMLVLVQKQTSGDGLRCIGALDETHILVTVSPYERPRYCNRNGDVSTNVLAVCDPDLRFIYVLPGWEGSARDFQVSTFLWM
ncbi:protein ALP1-like [Glycine soja]|uniref:protein ALP1-like n=1 Tax=Glycine soja TaxID=3848 RepID=UPI001039708C|nr:protein ALP1-like [Glycine soja]